MSNLAPDPRVGLVIGGRYRVLSVLGRGGMGVLYTAEHELTQRRVAIKLLHPDREEAPALHARFLVEARTAAAVRHPNIVDVLDMGVHDDGSPFLVMELLEGESLDKALVARRRVSPEQTLTWLLPIAGALATLHARGIIHRDVKPSNIFLSTSPSRTVQPKLLDFGLARAVSDLRLTRSGLVVGTPAYMSPEHAGGEEVTLQTDVWSLGIVLYECLSGELPFSSRDSAAIATQILAGKIKSLRETAPDVPPALAQAVQRALRRDLAVRYSSMTELAQALVTAAELDGIPTPDHPDPVGLPGLSKGAVQRDALATTLSTAAPRLDVHAPTVPRPSVQRDSKRDAVPAQPRSTRALATVSVLGALVLGAAAYAWWSAQDDEVPPIAPAADAAPPTPAALSPPLPSTPAAAAPPSVAPAPTTTDTPTSVSTEPASGTPSAPAANGDPTGAERPTPKAAAPREAPKKKRPPRNASSALEAPQGATRAPAASSLENPIETEWK